MYRDNLYLWVLEQNKFRCETCGAQDGEKSKITRKNVRVFVGHLDGDLENLSRRNLQAICDVCYQVSRKQAVQAALLFYDGEIRHLPRALGRAVRTSEQALSQPELFTETVACLPKESYG
jgi:hypothetical protein